MINKHGEEKHKPLTYGELASLERTGFTGTAFITPTPLGGIRLKIQGSPEERALLSASGSFLQQLEDGEMLHWFQPLLEDTGWERAIN